MKQAGIISMLTSIVVSFMLIVATLGLTILVNSSIGQGSDDELSLRAYGGAEGGVEYLTQYGSDHANGNIALTYTTLPSSCNSILNDTSGPGNPANSHSYNPNYPAIFTFNAMDYLGHVDADASYQNAITCLTVANQVNGVSGRLIPNTDTGSAEVKILPTSTDYLNRIQVQWISPSDTQPTQAASIAAPLPSTGPPAIELVIVSFPYSVSTQLINPTQVTVRNVLLLPSTGASAQNGRNTKYVVQCSPPGATYSCDTGPNLLSGVSAGFGAIVYIKSRYDSVNYQLTFRNQNGAIMTVPDQYATVDVTSRAGPVYRRLIAKYSIGRFGPPSGLEYVLFGDQDVCKDYSLYQDSSGNYQVGNGTDNFLCGTTGGSGGTPPTTTIVNDHDVGSANNQFNYSGSSGSWVPVASSANCAGVGITYLGDCYYNDTNGSSYTVGFNGSAVTYWSFKAGDGAKVDLYIDNVLNQTVDLYSPTIQATAALASITGLTSGQHTLKVVANGHNASSTGFSNNADRVDVTSP